MLATGFDPGIGCYFQDARILWLLGYPVRAVELVADAVRVARKLGNPLMVQFALFFTAWIWQLRREPELVLEVLREAVPMAEERGHRMLIGWMNPLAGWAQAQMGDVAGGAAKIRRAIADLREIGTELMRPSFLTLLADSCMRDDRVDEARTSLVEARELAEKTGERYYESEILRLTGELAYRRGHEAEAIETLEQAIAIARRQEALSLELRATVSLARMMKHDGNIRDANAALDAVMGKFTEGAEVVDFREASALREAQLIP
jgi:predicted ATPase